MKVVQKLVAVPELSNVDIAPSTYNEWVRYAKAEGIFAEP